jgi:hypothetical protein
VVFEMTLMSNKNYTTNCCSVRLKLGQRAQKFHPKNASPLINTQWIPSKMFSKGRRNISFLRGKTA